MPRSTYYYYLCKTSKSDKYATVKQMILKAFNDSKQTYGYRRIELVLRQNGYVINHKTVLKLMNMLNLRIKVRRAKYKSYKGEVGKVAPNILNRQFSATAPNQKWVTDVTEFNVCDEKVYLSPIMYNREIVSYSISLTPNFAQTKDMINNAIKMLKSSDRPILHSDQGWQYQMKPYQRILKENNITQSMSRKGNCLDNACM